MARPPKDPSPVASTSGVANAQGQAIFTGDWNALITDYVSQTDTPDQQVNSILNVNTNLVSPALLKVNGADALHGLDIYGSSDPVFAQTMALAARLKSTDFGNLFELNFQDVSGVGIIGYNGNAAQRVTVGDGSANTLGLELSAPSPSQLGAISSGIHLLSPANPGQLYGTGAQVGLPTGITGGDTGTLAGGGHRHAFSGRFNLGGFITTPAGAGTKFARFKMLNAVTMQRVSVYALTAPTGAGESWGIVNAAGTLQGTAAALGSGVKENEQAQTAVLTGNTIYYLAQIAAAATTPSANVNVILEYTMNV